VAVEAPFEMPQFFCAVTSRFNGISLPVYLAKIRSELDHCTDEEPNSHDI